MHACVITHALAQAANSQTIMQLPQEQCGPGGPSYSSPAAVWLPTPTLTQINQHARAAGCSRWRNTLSSFKPDLARKKDDPSRRIKDALLLLGIKAQLPRASLHAFMPSRASFTTSYILVLPNLRTKYQPREVWIQGSPAGRALGLIPSQSRQRPWRRVLLSAHTPRGPWGSQIAPHAPHGPSQCPLRPYPCTPAPWALPALAPPGTPAAKPFHYQQSGGCPGLI